MTTDVKPKRRSIVEFEKWLDVEIAETQQELDRADAVVAQVAQQRAAQEIRLETLQSVKAKIAIPPTDSDEGDDDANGKN